VESLSIDERQEAAMRELELRRNAREAALVGKSSNYLENPQLKQFNKQLRDIGMKRARKSIKLGNIDETQKEIMDYFDLCDEYSQIPSIKSLCLYLGISISTYSSYLRDPDSEYSEVFRAASDFIHSVIENGAMNNKINPATYMFTASNFYGMRDSKQIDISAVAPSQNNAVSSRESLNALRQQIEEENKNKDAIEPDFVDKSGDTNEC